MVELVVIIVALILWMILRYQRRTPVYFASKTLQRHKHEIPPELLNETFETFPIYKHITLEVSEHWLRIKKRRRDIWYPKNFIIGAYQFQTPGETDDYWVKICMITGELSDEITIPNTNSCREIFLHAMQALKRVLPKEAIVENGSSFYLWFSNHKKLIKNHFNQLVAEKGIQYLIENHVDFYELFSMDGTMVDEINQGAKVDVVLEENEANGTLTQGHVDKLVRPYNDKKGCKVVLKESGKIGRVKKVYGKASRYDIDSSVDDSEEYYKEYPEERKKDEARVESRQQQVNLRFGWSEYKNFVMSCAFLALTVWLVSVLCYAWGYSSSGCSVVFMISLFILNWITYIVFGMRSRYAKNYEIGLGYGLIGFGVILLVKTIILFVMTFIPISFITSATIPTIIRMENVLAGNVTFLYVAEAATAAIFITFLYVSIRKIHGLKPKNRN